MTVEGAIQWLKFCKAMIEFNPLTGEAATLNNDSKKVSMSLTIAIDALEKQTEYQKRIKGLISTIEDICKNSRDRHVDEEHCGLCEYDGAYMGASGDWCNECPGFDKDDCFELKKEFKRKYIDWEEE